MRLAPRWLLAGALAMLPALMQASVRDPSAPLQEQVRHELAMLPYYNVFDNLAFRLDGNRVILLGQVVRPWLKSDAERAVRSVPGVAAVDNRIEVLPLSPFDNSVRWGVARAVYSQPSLQRYGMGAQPSIHIIVKNGNVTLTGVVNNQADKNLAGIRANGVFGVFSVTNDLAVAKG